MARAGGRVRQHLGRAGALMIEREHAERRGAQRDLAADFAEADESRWSRRRAIACRRRGDSCRLACACARTAGTAIPRCLMRATLTRPLTVFELARQHQHQCEAMLGAGDIGAPAQREKFDAFRPHGVHVDVAEAGAELLHDFELRLAFAQIVCSQLGSFRPRGFARRAPGWRASPPPTPSTGRRPGEVPGEPLRTRSAQPAKSGSSCAMKSAKAAKRSLLAFGSSTRGISRVNGSSSTTMTGGVGTR